MPDSVGNEEKVVSFALLCCLILFLCITETKKVKATGKLLSIEMNINRLFFHHDFSKTLKFSVKCRDVDFFGSIFTLIAVNEY